MTQNQVKRPLWIYIMQILSLSMIWLLVFGIIAWILNLINLSLYLKDAQNATLGISLIIIPIFVGLASILTYVFFGIRRANIENNTD